MVDLVFWIVVGVTIISAVMVVQSKQLLYSAIALLFTFVGVAGLYIFLWADFIAAVQVVVYVGGILVLIVFGIMLTNKITSVNISHTSVQRGIGATVVLGILAGIGFMIINTPWYQVAATEPAQTTETIGRLLMMDYLLPFEVASLLLLGALIGATTLSRKEE
ncbi:NADH-ubiquinone oxidoreductase chain J [hydrothermal vent metagenome]|jgi:NADH-quinone oxidoreductase subunit J|uniref:NADH-ubiquinone oxidoreductase chain J n=1 Tax=hydrothermal vent metagenome TaxID=652676 RepID=A0A160VFE3_9ZZZZ